MKKIYLLPNVITAFGLTCGLFIIFKMNMVAAGKATPEVLVATAGVLILAALADLFDGAIARVMKAESAFGTLFDSLADAITFGVAPTVIVLKTLSIEPGTDLSFLMTAVAMVYSLCGILRLVRYNVQTEEEALEGLRNFTGMPIPSAAGALVSLNFFLFEWGGALAPGWRSALLIAAMLFLGYMMISRWRFPSFKTFHVRVASFRMVLATVILAAFIFYGIFHHFSLVFFVLTWAYLLISLLLSLIRIIAGRKAKALEDFEPTPPEE